MCGALYLVETNQHHFSVHIQEIANKIKAECGVNDWETATEEQLKLRDRIHENIFVLADVLRTNRDTLVAVATKKARESLEKDTPAKLSA